MMKTGSVVIIAVLMMVSFSLALLLITGMKEKCVPEGDFTFLDLDGPAAPTSFN